jgi:hypothetical protein
MHAAMESKISAFVVCLSVALTSACGDRPAAPRGIEREIQRSIARTHRRMDPARERIDERMAATQARLDREAADIHARVTAAAAHRVR